MNAVIAGLNADSAAVDLDVGAFDALGGDDRYGSAVDLHHGGAVNAVVARLDSQAAAADVDVAQGIVVLVFGVQAVRPGSQVQRAVRDADGIIGLDGFGAGFDGIRAAGDLHIILANNAVVSGGNGQQAPRWQLLAIGALFAELIGTFQ